MKLFVCFGGSAAVVDDDMEAAAVLAVRHRGHHQRDRARSLSFRGNFFFSVSSKGKTKKLSAAASPPAPEAKRLGVEADDAAAAYGLTRASASSSSVPSLALLSSAASLDSNSSSPFRSSAVSSSPSVSGVLFPPPAERRQGSPAAGAAAVVLCLLMVVFCGRVGATVLTSTAFYLFPLRWHARPTGKEDGVGVAGVRRRRGDGEEE